MSVSAYKGVSAVSDLVRGALTALGERDCESDDPRVRLANALLEEAVRELPGALGSIVMDLTTEEVRALDTWRTRDMLDDEDPHLAPGRRTYAVRVESIKEAATTVAPRVAKRSRSKGGAK